MNALVVFGSTMGQTEKVANAIAETLKKSDSPSFVRVDCISAADAVTAGDGRVLPLSEYSIRFLASNVRMGGLHADVVAFAKKHGPELSVNSERNVAVNVSLSTAGTQGELDTEGQTEEKLAKSKASEELYFTLLHTATEEACPNPVHRMPVAGAVTYQKYNFAVRWLLRVISGISDTSKNHEYTDWKKLEKETIEVVAAVLSNKGPQ